MESDADSIGAIMPEKVNRKQGGLEKGKRSGGNTNGLHHSKPNLDLQRRVILDLGVNTSEVRMRKQKSRHSSDRSRGENFLASRSRENLKGYCSKDSLDATVAIPGDTQNQEWNEKDTMGERRPSMLSMVTWQDGRSNDEPKSNDSFQVSQIVTKSSDEVGDTPSLSHKVRQSKSEGRDLYNEDRPLHRQQFLSSSRIAGNHNDIEERHKIRQQYTVEQNQSPNSDLARSPYEMEMRKKQEERSFQKAQSGLDVDLASDVGRSTNFRAPRSRSMDLRGGSYGRSFEHHEGNGRNMMATNQGVHTFRENEEVLHQFRNKDINHSTQKHRRHTMQHCSLDDTHLNNSRDFASRRNVAALDHQLHNREQFESVRKSPIQHTLTDNPHPSHDQAYARGDTRMKVQSYNEGQTQIHASSRAFRRHTMDLTGNSNEHTNEEHRRRTMQLGSRAEISSHGSRHLHESSSRASSDRILPGGTNNRENFKQHTRRAHSDPRNGFIAQTSHAPRREYVEDEQKKNHFVIKEMSPWLEHSRDPAHRRSPPGPHGKPHFNPMEDVEKFELEEKEEEKQMIQAREQNHNPIRRMSIKSPGASTIVNAVDEMKNICEEFALFFNSQDANNRSDGNPRKQSDILSRLEDLISTKQKLPVCQSFPKDLLQIIKLLPGNDKCCDCATKFQGKLSYGSPTYGCLLCGHCAFRHKNTHLNGEESPTLIIPFDDGEWTLPHMIAMVEGGNKAFADFVQKNDKTKKQRRSTMSMDTRSRKKGALLQPSESHLSNKRKSLQHVGFENDVLKAYFEKVYSSRSVSSYRKILLDRTQWVLLKKVLYGQKH